MASAGSLGPSSQGLRPFPPRELHPATARGGSLGGSRAEERVQRGSRGPQERGNTSCVLERGSTGCSDDPGCGEGAKDWGEEGRVGEEAWQRPAEPRRRAMSRSSSQSSSSSSNTLEEELLEPLRPADTAEGAADVARGGADVAGARSRGDAEVALQQLRNVVLGSRQGSRRHGRRCVAFEYSTYRTHSTYGTHGTHGTHSRDSPASAASQERMGARREEALGCRAGTPLRYPLGPSSSAGEGRGGPQGQQRGGEGTALHKIPQLHKVGTMPVQRAPPHASGVPRGGHPGAWGEQEEAGEGGGGGEGLGVVRRRRWGFLRKVALSLKEQSSGESLLEDSPRGRGGGRGAERGQERGDARARWDTQRGQEQGNTGTSWDAQRGQEQDNTGTSWDTQRGQAQGINMASREEQGGVQRESRLWDVASGTASVQRSQNAPFPRRTPQFLTKQASSGLRYILNPVVSQSDPFIRGPSSPLHPSLHQSQSPAAEDSASAQHGSASSQPGSASGQPGSASSQPGSAGARGRARGGRGLLQSFKSWKEPRRQLALGLGQDSPLWGGAPSSSPAQQHQAMERGQSQVTGHKQQQAASHKSQGAEPRRVPGPGTRSGPQGQWEGRGQQRKGSFSGPVLGTGRGQRSAVYPKSVSSGAPVPAPPPARPSEPLSATLGPTRRPSAYPQSASGGAGPPPARPPSLASAFPKSKSSGATTGGAPLVCHAGVGDRAERGQERGANVITLEELIGDGFGREKVWKSEKEKGGRERAWNSEQDEGGGEGESDSEAALWAFPCESDGACDQNSQGVEGEGAGAPPERPGYASETPEADRIEPQRYASDSQEEVKGRYARGVPGAEQGHELVRYASELLWQQQPVRPMGPPRSLAHRRWGSGVPLSTPSPSATHHGPLAPIHPPTGAHTAGLVHPPHTPLTGAHTPSLGSAAPRAGRLPAGTKPHRNPSIPFSHKDVGQRSPLLPFLSYKDVGPRARLSEPGRSFQEPGGAPRDARRLPERGYQSFREQGAGGGLGEPGASKGMGEQGASKGVGEQGGGGGGQGGGGDAAEMDRKALLSEARQAALGPGVLRKAPRGSAAERPKLGARMDLDELTFKYYA